MGFNFYVSQRQLYGGLILYSFLTIYATYFLSFILLKPHLQWYTVNWSSKKGHIFFEVKLRKLLLGFVFEIRDIINTMLCPHMDTIGIHTVGDVVALRAHQHPQALALPLVTIQTLNVHKGLPACGAKETSLCCHFFLKN